MRYSSRAPKRLVGVNAGVFGVCIQGIYTLFTLYELGNQVCDSYDILYPNHE